jgi:hypothetical protein
MSKKETEAKREVVLNPQRMHLSEHARRDWVVNAEEGTTIQDVMGPSYWAHKAAELTPYDHIEVRLETGEWMLELVVLGCGRNWARVHVLHKHDLEPIEAELPAAQKHMVKWKGPELKWCVIRLSDSEVIFKGIADKSTANGQLKSYEQATA